MILLTACSSEWEEMRKLTESNRIDYCMRWNITLISLANYPSNCWDRPRLWLKTLRELSVNEWMWFIGADTLIMNHARIYSPPDCDLCIGLDVLGINSDSFFIRHTPASIAFLEAVISLEGCEDNEQEAMWRCMGNGLCNAVIKPQRAFNSYLYENYGYKSDRGGSYQPGDLLLHLPGIPFHRRMELMRYYLPLVDKE